MHRSRGLDAAKKVKGKKRHVAVDTLGLMLGVAITPASVQDRDQIAPLLREVRRLFPFLQRAIADSGYQDRLLASMGISLSAFWGSRYKTSRPRQA